MPHVAVFVGLLLAICSVGVLIYFMHHVPESIHVSNVTARIGQELNARIDTAFRTSENAESRVDHAACELPDDFHENCAVVRSHKSGYVHNFDLRDLIELAEARDLVLEVLARPGDFLIVDQPLACLWPRERLEAPVADGIRRTFAVGPARTPIQDPLFLVNELVQIAARALSPGVNDPFTTIGCMHWLKNCLANAARKAASPSRYCDDSGSLRVVDHPLDFEVLLEAAFGQLCPYAAGDPNAAQAMLQCLAELTVAAPDESQLAAVADVAKGHQP